MYSWGYKSELAVDNEKLAKLGNEAAEAIKAVNGREYEVETAAGMYPAGEILVLFKELI